MMDVITVDVDDVRCCAVAGGGVVNGKRVELMPEHVCV